MGSAGSKLHTKRRTNPFTDKNPFKENVVAGRHRGCSEKIKNMNIRLETHFPKGIEQKSFHGQIREIFPEILWGKIKKKFIH